VITESDLQEAIAECEGTRNPNASTCIKLAAFYTIRKELYGEDPPQKVVENIDRSFRGEDLAPMSSMSFATETDYDSGSEFSEAIKGKPLAECLAVIDEMMDVIQTLVPRLYNGVIRKLHDV